MMAFSVSPIIRSLCFGALLFSVGGARDLPNRADLSYIRNWGAIGESYAAGLGAGDRIAYWCSRYAGGYPELVNADLSLGNPAYRVFTNLACSGAKIPAIIKQAEALAPQQQVITISAGGNDVKLSKILDACVFTFSGYRAANCENSLSEGLAIVQGADFSNNLDSLITTAASKLSILGKIYYTGYPRFFDDETELCDHISWQIFYSSTGKKQYLTRDRRQKMNALVDAVNTQLGSAVLKAADAGKRISFIPYDEDYAEIQGLYCEPGVDESKRAAAQRTGLLFYEFSTKDSSWGKPQWDPSIAQKRQESNETLPEDYSDHGHYEDRAKIFDTAIRNTIAHNPDLKLDPDVVGQELYDYYHDNETVGSRIPIAPDFLTKVFHPQQAGQSLIANLVIHNLLYDLVEGQGYPGPSRDIQSTPVCDNVEISQPLPPYISGPYILSPPEGFDIVFLENTVLDPLYTGCTSIIHPIRSISMTSTADDWIVCSQFCQETVGCASFYISSFVGTSQVNCQAFFVLIDPVIMFTCGSKDGNAPNNGAAFNKS